MIEPRTAVHTKRDYGNFPVSLVKHAQENCQKIQDLKKCNRFSMRFKCKGYRVYKWECIKMFFFFFISKVAENGSDLSQYKQFSS